MKRLALLFPLLLVGCSLYPSAQDRGLYVEKHNVPAHIERAILDQRPAMGMSYGQLVAALGKPHGTNVTQTSHGLSEQFIYTSYYKYGANGTLYVYLRNGKVIGMQF